MGLGHGVAATYVTRAGERTSAPANRRIARAASNFFWNGLGLLIGMTLLASAFIAWF